MEKDSEHPDLPDPDPAAQIRVAGDQLKDTIVFKAGQLADQILGRPEFGTDAWLAERAARDTPTGQQRLREWHLVKIRLYTVVGMDPIGDAINARKAGATWDDIGDACGMTSQSAQERWAMHTEHLGDDEPPRRPMPRGVPPYLEALDGEDLG